MFLSKLKQTLSFCKIHNFQRYNFNSISNQMHQISILSECMRTDFAYNNNLINNILPLDNIPIAEFNKKTKIALKKRVKRKTGRDIKLRHRNK